MTERTNPVELKICLDSWHASIVGMFGGPMPTNLCSYFWQWLLHTWILCFMGCACIVLLLFLVDPFVTLGVQYYIGYHLTSTFLAYCVVFGTPHMGLTTLIPVGPWSFLMSLLTYGALAFLGFCYWASNQYDKHKLTTKQPKKQRKGFLGLVFRYLAAKKAKVCPVVSYVDDEGKPFKRVF